MNHSFDTELATRYGILESILLQDIYFWVIKNETNQTNFHDGRYWTFNSIKAFSVLYPYATQKKIRSALDKLRKEGLVETGTYGENRFNRSLWYTITDKGREEIECVQKGKCICPTGQATEDMGCPTGQVHLPYRANDINNNNTNILETDTNYTDTNNNTDTYTPYNPPRDAPADIVNLYNEICISLPKVKDLTDKRKRAIKNLLNKYTDGDIEQVFMMAEESDFLSGRNGSWNGCGFDWLMNANNFVKVREGNYSNKKSTIDWSNV